MDDKKIPNNNQYQKCFSQRELNRLDSKIQQALDLGRQLSENGIDDYPKLVRDFLSNNFEQ